MKILFSAFVLIFLFTPVLSAQTGGTRWEVAPFAGFETGASFPVQSRIDPLTGLPTSPIDQLHVEKGLTYGGFLDYAKSENLEYEFMWARNPTYYNQHDFVVNQWFKAYNTNFDQYQFGVLFDLKDSTQKMRPYIALGLGFTHESNDNNTSNTAFAFSAGGGARYYMSKHFGLRGDLRFIPTYANSVQGQVCDPYYGCYSAPQRNFLKRVNFAGGLAFRF